MHDLLTKQSSCPYCGEPIELIVNTSIPKQEYIEDCQVCCRPIIVSIEVGSNDHIHLSTRSENE